MIFAAILAGGIGTRMERYSIPKQFIDLSGKPVIIRTLGRFVENGRFEKIYIAVHKDWIDHMNKLLAAYFSNEQQSRIMVMEGGRERLDSFVNVMEAVISTYGQNEEDILICHDSVRPFVTQQMINDCIDATLENGLALTVVPTVDTIHISHEEQFIDGTLDRKGLYNGQNPSGFNIALLKKVLASFSDDEKKGVTGTTQLMLKLGYKLRIVRGHASNFKITTDNDIDVAERMLNSKRHEHRMRLLDCTLRDGGIVLDFNFGTKRMQKIKATLEKSGVDCIECGYIDQKKGTVEGRTQFDSEVSIRRNLLNSGKKPGLAYVAMVDYGTYDPSKLEERREDGIDGIRLAFHKENWRDAIAWGKTILAKGYDLYIQPMVTLRYSDEELVELIRTCNEELSAAKGIYAVDSFGQMDGMALLHILEIMEANVSPSMVIGFHAHNNRQMAFSNARVFLDFNTKHDVILDASIMGMGKGAGNLCTELIEPILNEQGKGYDVNFIYDEISEYFAEAIKKHPWGYSLDYYLSSVYSCTPSYIKIFLKDERVTTDVLVELLRTIPEEKKAACDRTFAAEHLKRYFED